MKKENYHVVVLPIPRAIHADLAVAAKRDRRSVTNLIQLILDKWSREYRGEGKDDN